MHFMLQKEVVERMAAGPGSKVYGRLSVMLQAYCAVTPLFTVPPGAFRPAPKVDSAVVRLVPRPAGEIGIDDPQPLRRDRPRRLRPAPQDAAQRARWRRRQRDHRWPRASVRTRAPSNWRSPISCGWPTAAACVAHAFTLRRLHCRAWTTDDYAFDIDVATRYLDEQSEPEQDRYVFAYTIHIRNNGKRARAPARPPLGDHRRQRQGRRK